jgi:hypothetical protein
MAVPTKIAPSSKTWLGVQREEVTGTPETPVMTIPLDKNSFNPEDTPKFLPDEAIRGVMASLFNDVIGPEDATFSFGGPMFFDVGGVWIDNVFGDLSSTSSGTLGTAIAINAAIAVGGTVATTGTVSIGTVATGSVIQINDGTASEIVLATAGSSGTIVYFTENPARFPHGTTSTLQLELVASNYTHKFALLNSGGVYSGAQPPTHTLTDYTGLTATVGARAYPSACVSQMDFTGSAEQLLMQKVTGNSWLSAAAGTTPTNTTTFTVPQANWRSTVAVGGSTISSIGEWAMSAKRQLQIYWTAQGAQNPYVIARGGLNVALTTNYTVASDESALTNMLTAGPLAVQFQLSNGGTGSSLLSFTFNATKAQAIKSKIDRNAVLVGYSDEWECLANTTDVGGTGGLGPATITLINATPTY